MVSESPISSLHSICRLLNVRPVALQRRFPDICSKIIADGAKYRQIRVKKRRDKYEKLLTKHVTRVWVECVDDNFVEKVRKVAAAMKASGFNYIVKNEREIRRMFKLIAAHHNEQAVKSY